MNTQEQRIVLPPRRHWTRQTHRVLGVFSVVFLIFIAASGLILNHADDFGMSHRAAGPWLLRLYGAEAPPVDSAYSAENVLFATSSATLYADGKELAKNTGPLVGAVTIDDAYVVATSQEFLLSSHDLILVERYAPDAPGPMQRLGTSGDHIIVAIEDELYAFDPLRMELTAQSDLTMPSILWAQPATPSDEQAEQIGAAALGQAINWERVLLDFHSGRILPTVGRYIADLTALCLLYMCFTGIFMWVRKR